MGNVTNKRAEVFQDIEQTLGMVPEWVRGMPDGALSGFWSLMRDFSFAETKIPNKYKELIGVAVAGATRCRYCQLFHAEGARLNGATDEEIAEASAIAGFTMMGSTYLNAMGVSYEQFEQETRQMVEYAKSHAPVPAARTSLRESHA
jgi:AhpD family alkylhydroperoxidase